MNATSHGPSSSSAPDSGRFDVPNDKDAIESVQASIVEAVERHNYPKAAVFAIRLSMHEAISNAFGHGHKNLPSSVPVTVTYRVNANRVEISVEDRGPGFHPEEIPDPTLDENLENTSGRGLMLMRAYMTSVTYNASGNRLDMVYQRPRGS